MMELKSVGICLFPTEWKVIKFHAWQIQLREAYLHLHRLRLLAKGNNRDSKARNNCGPAFSRSKQHVQMDPPIAKICEDKLARLFGRARVPLWCRYAGKSQSSRAARIEPAAH